MLSEHSIEIPAGVPHEQYCTLCGVPFGSYWGLCCDYGDDQDEFIWVSYFLALRIPKDKTTVLATGSDSGLCITGIGQHDHQEPRIPPPGYAIRDILKRRISPPAGKLKYLMSEDERKEWKNFHPMYRSIRGSEDPDIFYLMHPRCWEILLQQYALVAPPTKTCLDLNELGKIFIQVPLNECGGGFRPNWTTDYAGPEQPFWINSPQRD